MVSGSTILNGPKESNVTDENAQCPPSAQQKKKRRRRTKKGAVKSKDTCLGVLEDAPANAPFRQQANTNAKQAQSQSVLCISRNKHWKHISAYHGPWLQLPVELLESLLILNLDPATVASEHNSRIASFAPSSNVDSSSQQQGRKRGSARLLDRNSSSANGSRQRSPTDSPALNAYPNLPSLSAPLGKAAPPPIDPGVFRSVTVIRRLIDEAAELSVRASSGLSAAALGALQAGGGDGAGAFGLNGSAAQALGFNHLGDIGGGGGGGGRNVPMSANRVHRLRTLAVQKLAEAYRADEIAASVMVMQRGTVFDDIAEKALRFDPKNVDARYVHFFHEKIPSRQLAESTATTVLDQLITENPQRLEFYRTRGVVHCFRDEYSLAVKDYSHALKEARAARKARQAHSPSQRSIGGNGHSKSKRKKNKVNGQAPSEGTTAVIGNSDGEPLLPHPSVLSDAPEPIEHQCVFLRASAYFSHAIYLIEEAFFKLEEFPRIPVNDFGEMQLSYIRGKYGGTEVNNPEGPLGRSDGDKARAYRRFLGESPLREQICALLKKSKRDHEKFLAHFDSLEPPVEAFMGIDQPFDPLHKVERAFSLLDTYRPSRHQHDRKTEAQELPDVPLAFTTYHPLMLESHFTILICLLMLGDFEKLTSTLERTAGIVAGLEGYPVFLPPRSMAQGEFVETLERLASGWKYGKLPNALVRVQKQPVRSAHLEHHTLPAQLSLSTTGTCDELVIASSSFAGPSTFTSCCSSKTSPASGRRSPLSDDAETESVSPTDADDSTTACTEDAQLEANRRSALEHLRFLLAPVYSRLRARTDRQKTSGDEEKKTPLSLALHSARVEFILAWLAAVHLPELEAVAT